MSKVVLGTSTDTSRKDFGLYMAALDTSAETLYPFHPSLALPFHSYTPSTLCPFILASMFYPCALSPVCPHVLPTFHLCTILSLHLCPSYPSTRILDSHVEVSPPPLSRTTTQFMFTEWEMPFRRLSMSHQILMICFNKIIKSDISGVCAKSTQKYFKKVSAKIKLSSVRLELKTK